MSLNSAIKDNTIGNYEYDKYPHPLFRTGAQQAELWGHFTLKDVNQIADVNSYNMYNMGTYKIPAASNVGAVAQYGRNTNKNV